MDGLNEVTLVVKDNKEFRASRNVLSEASPYFSALLKSGMRESEEGIIRLEHITDTVMNDVLQFMRSGNIEITSTNVQDLIVAADYLLLPNLKTIAGRFLKDNMTTSNCISIYYFAEKYRCEERVIRKFILSNFEVVAKSEEFRNLECKQVEEWISSDEIAISSEKEVIKVILKWTEQRKNERKGKLADLFRHVRFAFVSRDYLKDVVTNHVVRENSSCLKLVKDAMKGTHNETDRAIPPPSRNWQHSHLVVLAGNETSCYDPDEEKWYQMKKVRRYHPEYNLLSFQGNLHVFPQPIFRGDDLYQSERYDTLYDHWVSLDLAQRHFEHRTRITAVLGTEIYAIDFPRNILKYNIDSNAWQAVLSLPHDGPCQGSCVVAMDNCLYVIGGAWKQPGTKHSFRPSAHSVRFSTITQQWERIANMQCARHNACGVAARGKIFIAGGITDGVLSDCDEVLRPDDVTETCEMFNVSTNEWQFIASLQKPFCGGSMVYLKGSLYVVGGKRFRVQFINGSPLNRDYILKDTLDVDCYDFESNTWKPKTKIPLSSRDNPWTWRNIKACTLTVCNQVLQKPITQSARFQLLKKLLTPSKG